jgi:hypothetical protein
MRPPESFTGGRIVFALKLSLEFPARHESWRIMLAF